MMTKETFVNLMQEWKQLDDDVNKLDDVVNDLFGGSVWELFCRFDDLIANAISASVEDEDDWISYFAFDRDMNLENDCVFDAHGDPIPTHTWEDVYDLITDNSYTYPAHIRGWRGDDDEDGDLDE